MKKVLAVCLVAVALPLLAERPGDANKLHKKPRAVRNSYIVVVDDSEKPRVAALADALAASHGGRVKSVWEHALTGFAIEATEAAALAISRHPKVSYVEEDQEAEYAHCPYAHVTAPEGKCPDGSVPWHLDRIDQRDLPLNQTFEYCITNEAEDVTMYIIDSGIRTHADFEDENGASRLAVGWNTAAKNTNTDDCYGHGTYVASVAAGRYHGVAKDATIVPVKVASSCTGSTTNQYLIDAVNWVTNHHVSGPAVTNMSVVITGGSSALDTAATNLINDGVVLTVAAGNANSTSGCNSSPQRVANAIVVGATTKTDAKASFSNYGSCVTLFAPGLATGGAHHPNYLAFNCNPGWNGTSVAAPQAAGVAALILNQASWYPYTAAEVKQQMIDQATKGKITGLPSGTANRLLYSAYDGWCPPAMCYTPPPSDY